MESNISNEDPFRLSPLWNAILDIYHEFAVICDRHGLRYFAVGGTLLGAVRHKGFIPWDDDFDLAMPRQDYEKFVAIAHDELPRHLRFVDRHAAPEFTSLFGKIQDSRKDFVLEVENRVGRMLSGGIYIDLFPIDGYPSTFVGAACWKAWEIISESAYRYNTRTWNRRNLSLKRRMVEFLGAIPAFVLPQTCTIDGYLKMADEYVKKLPFDDKKRTGIGGIFVGKFHMTFPPGIWGKGINLPFERIMIRAPEKWDQILKIHYGNYMMLPPKEKRRPSHSIAKRCPWWLGPTVMI